MDKDQESFLIELLNDFKIEASEHYQAIVEGLIVLEKSSDASVQQSTIERIFREVHSLKGSARAVNLLDIEKLCMSLENVFNSLKKGDAKLFLPMFDAFHKSTDLLYLLLNDVNQNKRNKGNYNLAQILKNLEFAHRNSMQQKKEQRDEENLNQEINTPVPDVDNKKNRHETPPERISIVTQYEKEVDENPKTQQKVSQTVRISTDKLSSLLQQSEELLTIKSMVGYFANELQDINDRYILWNKKLNEKSLSSKSSDTQLHLTVDSASEKNFRKKHTDELNQLTGEVLQFQHTSNRMIDELLYTIKTALLFPFSSMLGIFPKIVRDLSKEYSKEIDIDIIGDSIEIDKRILEEIKDPLIHLIRNCIDHGIENLDERKIKGKPLKGRIEIEITQDIDRKIELKIKDDGAGIDKSRIINSALKLNILKQDEIEKLSEKEINSLIFHSGISTSPFITDISGRGLGMAIVAEKVAQLGGSIVLETLKDSGTTFTISLPQTLSTFRGVLIRTSEQYFILPSSVVDRALRIQHSDIKTVESRKTICYKNETIALALLSDVLKISAVKKKVNKEDFLHLLILNISQKKIAFVVDEILGEQEGLVKDLGSQLLHITNIAGATILGNGNVVPIIHPFELMESAAKTNSSMDYSVENKASTENVKGKNILVAEDSITIRTMLRNFIENAGFTVKTAVDGMEAFNFLQNENFDLVVSDVEMPRMNGFELTAKIRDDKKYGDIPVILVTALDSAYDKQRGMEAGANAYIIKSSFEKSNLIETIQRLI